MRCWSRRACGRHIRACGSETTSTRSTATTPIATRTVPMFERLGAGVTAPARPRRRPSGPARAEDYEAILAPIYAWIHAVAQYRTGPPAGAGTDGASSRAWRTLRSDSGKRAEPPPDRAEAGVPGGDRRRSTAPGLGPLSADISGIRAAPGRAAGARRRRCARLGVRRRPRDLRPHPPRRPAARATTSPNGARPRAAAC